MNAEDAVYQESGCLTITTSLTRECGGDAAVE
jgi:hypothetical protein